MTTAEKRADLEARGVPWPDCDCHDEPMLWQRDTTYTDGGKFHCRVRLREWRKKWRESRQRRGLCVECAEPTSNDYRCDTCMGEQADYMATPKQQMLSQLATIRHRRRQSDFRPTGVGFAAAAAFTEGRKD